MTLSGDTLYLSAVDAPTRAVATWIAEIGPAQSEEFTPHMLNLDLLGAVSFDKGCYTGQEIIARMESRNRLAKIMTKLRP